MLKCTIISEEDTRNYQDLRSVILPAVSGEMQILPEHAEVFVVLKQGFIKLQNGSGSEDVEISGGECYARDDEVKVIL